MIKALFFIFSFFTFNLLTAQSKSSNTIPDTNYIYSIADQKPIFGKGDLDIYSFISKNLKYPMQARDNGVEGTIKVSFVVERNGNISQVEAINKIGFGLENEAVRVVTLMNSWKPAIYLNTPVRFKFVIPIKFNLF